MSPFYVDKLRKEPVGLWKGCEFGLCTPWKIDTLMEGVLIEYPTSNVCPPFWRYLKQIRKGDTDLGKLFEYPVGISFGFEIIELEKLMHPFILSV